MSGLKKGLLITGIVFAVAIMAYSAAVFLSAKISITMQGDAFVSLEVFDEYDESGATAKVEFPLLFGYTKVLKVKSVGEVQTDKIGEYVINYKANCFYRKVRLSRTVKIEDSVAPILKLEKDFIERNADELITSADEVNIGFTATDNYDKDIASRVVKELDGNVCRYIVRDSCGNTTTAEVKIIYTDTTKPKIKLKGNSTVYMQINTDYKELGYTVTDNFDTDISSNVQIVGNVNMNKRGTYSVTYTATDGAGNTSSVTRTVVVYGGEYNGEYDTVTPNNKVIYLTFDDGPSIYTERLLNTLQKYNIKATFFVTNQAPKYQYLITRMSLDGHTVALHTLTHKWDIYSSLETYLKDFNSMNAIIEQRTGSQTRFFRFPGGTSNKQGNRFKKGIMVELAEHMLESGYSYFDWNVSSGDTYLTDSSEIVNYLINQVSKRNTSIVLAHDIKKATVDAMPAFIEYALKNGYTFKAIDDTTEPIRFKPAS